MPLGTAFRVYQLAISDEKGLNNNPSQHSKVPENMAYFDKLQMTASINYSADKTKVSSDDTSIEIYNLTPEARKLFKQDKATIMLRAGYDDTFDRDEQGYIVPRYEELPIIYIGSVIYAYSEKRGMDFVTKVYCSSDKVERAVTKASLSFAPNTPRATVVEALAKQLSLPILELETSHIQGQVYEGGLSIYGRVADELTRVCEENGLVWFTHNKQVRVVPVKNIPKLLAWEIHPYNVIDSVEGYYQRTETPEKPKKVSAHPRGHKKPSTPKETKKLPQNVTEVKTSDMTQKTKRGVKLKVHLDGRIKLGDNVKLVNMDEFTAQYKVIGIQHSLDYKGGSWQTELDLVEVETEKSAEQKAGDVSASKAAKASDAKRQAQQSTTKATTVTPSFMDKVKSGISHAAKTSEDLINKAETTVNEVENGVQNVIHKGEQLAGEALDSSGHAIMNAGESVVKTGQNMAGTK